jgi:serine/threonine protein kinase
MGVVYEAHDDRLDRVVALKLLRGAIGDATAIERFWREARAAASISHPHICQIYELGDDAGRPFIVMERLTGETLSDRLLRGPVAAREAAQFALSLLGALQALHQRHVVHRDLKPSNVFLTPHGVKLLDFGLARDVSAAPDMAAATRLTNPGVVIGTPHYMAPEQITGGPVDSRTDLFSAGAILFEMLSGQVAFGGDSTVEVLHKVLHDQPPALIGSTLVSALDRAIHRALAKRREDRYDSAEAMAADVRQALMLDDSGETTRVTAMTRLVVLPFRVLRPDPEIDFLSFSLPDAITGSLSTHDALSVRSTLAASRFAADAPDLRAIAEQLDVDLVLAGTLLRSGDQLRVTAQLVEAPGGRVIWSHSAQTALGDLFRLQDTLSQGIVHALPVGERQRPAADVPKTPRAYELYLRANQLALEPGTYRMAQRGYEQCLAEDPGFAPAWARLGRICRVVGKYLDRDPDPAYDAAEKAFERALAINPTLPVTHSLYSYLQVELGKADGAMVRLLAQARQHPANAELFASLVHACRYCGLLDASLAAHERASRLDPLMRTSVLHTYFMMGDYSRCLDESQWLSDPVVGVAALASLGRTEEVLAEIKVQEDRFAASTIDQNFLSFLRAETRGEREEAIQTLDVLMKSGLRDGEGMYYGVRVLARLGETERALAALRRTAELGFFCYPAFARDAWLDSLRGLPEFLQLMREVEARHRAAAAAFIEHGGDRLLHLSA